MKVVITLHAARRYCERIEPVDLSRANAAIREDLANIRRRVWRQVRTGRGEFIKGKRAIYLVRNRTIVSTMPLSWCNNPEAML